MIGPDRWEPRAVPGRRTRMTRTRTLAVVVAAGLTLVLTGCGAEGADDPASGSVVAQTTPAVSTAPTGDAADASPTAPEGGTADASPDPSPEMQRDNLGKVLLNQRLDVPPADYPLPDVPTAVEVTSVAELAEVFAAVPGIDAVLAELDETVVGPGERIFAYTVKACRTNKIELEVQGGEVLMVVRGNEAVRCLEPSPTLVVWLVGDDIPAEATPAPADQS